MTRSRACIIEKMRNTNRRIRTLYVRCSIELESYRTTFSYSNTNVQEFILSFTISLMIFMDRNRPLPQCTRALYRCLLNVQRSFFVAPTSLSLPRYSKFYKRNKPLRKTALDIVAPVSARGVGLCTALHTMPRVAPASTAPGVRPATATRRPSKEARTIKAPDGNVIQAKKAQATSIWT